jgi:transposase
MTPAALRKESKPSFETVYVGLELGLDKWVVCFSNGQKERIVELSTPSVAGLCSALEKTRDKLHLQQKARVLCCYEAGRHGFSVHRELLSRGVENIVVDSSSIEVPRRARRAKTDKIDARALTRLLIRHTGGEPRVLRAVRIPTREQEDERRPMREYNRLKGEKTGLTNRLKGLLALYGLRIRTFNEGFPGWLREQRLFDGTAVPEQMKAELLRSFERLQLVTRQLRELGRARVSRLREETKALNEDGRGRDAIAGLVLQLMQLTGIGDRSAWLLVTEFFSWRCFRNRKQVAAAAGLTPTPYASSTISREQGISKTGNPAIRWLMLQLAWRWLRLQPGSELSKWYEKKYAHAGSRQRRAGIVAIARRLLIDLWRYTTLGVVPEGAKLKAT